MNKNMSKFMKAQKIGLNEENQIYFSFNHLKYNVTKYKFQKEI